MMMIDTDRNRDLAKQWGVRGIPDMRYLDVDGKEVGKYKGRRSADSFAKEFADYSSKYTVKGKDDGKDNGKEEKVSIAWVNDFAKAREDSTKKRKVLFVIFSDGKEACTKTMEALTDARFKKTAEALVFASVTFDKESDLAKKLKVEDAGTILLLNPDEAEIDKAVLARKHAALNAGELKPILEPLEKPGFECEKCKKTSFVKKACDGADMKPVEKKD
jgi:thioredoxin-like negative regulator of GroEL